MSIEIVNLGLSAGFATGVVVGILLAIRAIRQPRIRFDMPTVRPVPPVCRYCRQPMFDLSPGRPGKWCCVTPGCSGLLLYRPEPRP